MPRLRFEHAQVTSSGRFPDADPFRSVRHFVAHPAGRQPIWLGCDAAGARLRQDGYCPCVGAFWPPKARIIQWYLKEETMDGGM